MNMGNIVICILMLAGNDGVKRNYSLSGQVLLEAQEPFHIWVDFLPGLQHNGFDLSKFKTTAFVVPRNQCWTPGHKKEFPENDR